MSNTALITGASSGIGREFARYHAALGGDVIVVARREAALLELKAELEQAHSVHVHVIACDLAAEGGAEALYAQVKALNVPVKVLINNAGFGGHGAFLERDLADDQRMVDLNISALMRLSHHIGRDMVASGGGRMLQVSSTASYMPGPGQAVYFATKAFVSSFSQAIDQEMRGQGVRSTALEPGLVLTEFVEVAGLEGTGLAKQKGAHPADVARIGYEAMLKGKLRVINEARLRFVLNWVLPFAPRRMVLKAMADMQR